MKSILASVALFSLSTLAIDSNYKPIDLSLVKNGELQLPEIGGSAKLPGPSYKWYSLPDAKGLKEYAVVEVSTGKQVVLQILLDQRVYAEAQFTNIFNHIQRMARDDLKNLGREITRDTTVVLDVPPHEKIKTHVLTGSSSGSESTILTFVISTGQSMIVVHDYSSDGKPTPRLKAFLGSLNYTKQSPRTGGIPPQTSPASAATKSDAGPSRILWYLIGGAVVAALVALYLWKKWKSEDQSAQKAERGPSNYRF